MICRLSIKRKIIGIALILIALMTVTALISLALVMQVSGRLEELTQSYVPAYRPWRGPMCTRLNARWRCAAW